MSRGQPKRRNASEAERARLALDLEALASMNLEAMRGLWRARLPQPYPPLLKSPEIFRGLLGWKLRIAVEGDVSPAARRKLAEIEAKAKTGEAVEPLHRLNIGVRLEREWLGALHEVDVVEDGFRHQGVVYRTLSEVARAITGNKWSGPTFFGLRQARRR